MPSQGPLSAGTGANDAAYGTEAWSSPGNITASDNIRATVSVATPPGGPGQKSNYLKATNFGFTIPASATIQGITVELECHSSLGAGNVGDDRVRIVKGGAVGATDRSDATAWFEPGSPSDSVRTYGGASDLWGETWTAAQINASDFGFVLAVVSTGPDFTSAQARVDNIRITVTYVELPPNVVSRIVYAPARKESHRFETRKVVYAPARIESHRGRPERETMVQVSAQAPGETQRLKWTFKLAAGETINAGSTTVTAVQNCTAGAPTVSGASVTALVSVGGAVPIGSVGQVRCDLTTSAGRVLDKTYQFDVAFSAEKHLLDAGEYDPDETEDFTVDAAALLAEVGDTISSVACALASGDVTLGATSNTTTTATVRITGGTAGIVQQVDFTLTTSIGRVLKLRVFFTTKTL